MTVFITVVIRPVTSWSAINRSKKRRAALTIPTIKDYYLNNIYYMNYMMNAEVFGYTMFFGQQHGIL